MHVFSSFNYNEKFDFLVRVSRSRAVFLKTTV